MVPWLVPGRVPLMTSLTGLEILVVGATGEERGEEGRGEEGRGGRGEEHLILHMSNNN